MVLRLPVERRKKIFLNAKAQRRKEGFVFGLQSGSVHNFRFYACLAFCAGNRKLIPAYC